MCQVIAKARVPIVKFVERKSGIAFDIRCSFVFIAQTNTRLLFLLSQFSVKNFFCSSFDIDGGPQAADFIKVLVELGN